MRIKPGDALTHYNLGNTLTRRVLDRSETNAWMDKMPPSAAVCQATMVSRCHTALRATPWTGSAFTTSSRSEIFVGQGRQNVTVLILL